MDTLRSGCLEISIWRYWDTLFCVKSTPCNSQHIRGTADLALLGFGILSLEMKHTKLCLKIVKVVFKVILLGSGMEKADWGSG